MFLISLTHEIGVLGNFALHKKKYTSYIKLNIFRTASTFYRVYIMSWFLIL